MKKNIKVTQFELTTELSDYLDKKIDMLERFTDPGDTTLICDVEVGKITEGQHTGRIYRAEINVHGRGIRLRAVALEESMTAAIDKAKNEMKCELRRSRSKGKTFLRRGGAQLKRLLRLERR